MSTAQPIEPLPDVPQPQSLDDFLAILAVNRETRHEAIRGVRSVHSLSVKAAAERTGISAGTINNWETGKRWPSSNDKLFSYLRGLGVPEPKLNQHFDRSKHLALQQQMNELQTADAIETLIRAESQGDIHEYQRIAWDIAIPKLIPALILKGASGDIPAIKLAKEWWKEWKHEDAGRKSGPSDAIPATASSWTQAALGNPAPDLGLDTRDNVNDERSDEVSD